MFWIASWTNQRVLQSTVGMTVTIQGPWTGRWTDCTDNWSFFVGCCFLVNIIIGLIACLQHFTVFWIGGEGKGGWRMLYNYKGVVFKIVIWGRRGVEKSTFFAFIYGPIIYGRSQIIDSASNLLLFPQKQPLLFGPCLLWPNCHPSQLTVLLSTCSVFGSVR